MTTATTADTATTAPSEVHRTRAAITVDAPADVVHRTLTDVLNWPLLYPWITHTEVVERHGIEDLSRFWAVRPGPEGGLRIWQSRRRVHDAELRMEFEQEGTVGAIRRLGGEWLFLPEGDGRCRVESHHWFTCDGDPADTREELDRHGALQMRTLKEAVEERAAKARSVLRAERSAVVPGTLPEVYARLARALGDTAPDAAESAEFTTAETARPDGSSSPARSVRITRAPHTLVLKHLDPAPEFALHRRVWRLRSAADGVRVTAEQLAVVRPDTLGDDPAAPDGARHRLLEWLDARAADDLATGTGHRV
ncbi:SRPBCC family protein [Streptomyces sp. NPDC017993]|uniref:SRPBCC family protein n=1 Tax=Streptomyces sp. NPDC017993 TaxID=3365027 RepID=UPI00379EF5C7